MEQPLNPQSSQQPKSLCYMGGALFWVRWVALAVLLLLTLPSPVAGRTGLPLWALLSLFIVYNLVVELLQSRLIKLYSTAWVPILDLPVTALIYYLGAMPGGPIFTLFILTVGCAAATLPLRGAIIYTALAALLVVVIAPTLPLWSPGMEARLELGEHLVVLAIVGCGTAILTDRLAQMRDRTRSRSEAALRRETLEQLRSQLIATISHDLRTPLTAVRSAVGLTITSARTRLSADEQDALETALRNIERLGILIDDLLVYNQMESGGMQLAKEPIDLRELVSEAATTIRPLLHERGQVLEIDLPEPLLACGDRRRLEQVVVNILANAHYHTPDGTRIAVTAYRTEDENVIVVRDNGPGIPHDVLESIFLHFHRLATTDGGSGLGLAIAREIVKLHEGRIWAESEPGHGASFYISLPRIEGGVA